MVRPLDNISDTHTVMAKSVDEEKDKYSILVEKKKII
jgi:hypothetical protein